MRNTYKALPSGLRSGRKHETKGQTVKCGKWQIEGAKQNQHSSGLPKALPQAGKKKREKTCSLVKNQLTNQHCMVSSGLRSTCFVTFTFHYTLLFPRFTDVGALWAQPPVLAQLLPLCLSSLGSAPGQGLLCLVFQPSTPSLHSPSLSVLFRSYPISVSLVNIL